MNMLNQAKAILGLAALAVLPVFGASQAQAEVIEARFNAVSPSADIAFSVDSGSNFNWTKAGNFDWTRLGGNYAGPGASGEFSTFCIELTQHINYGNTYQFETRLPEDAPIPGGGMGAAKADLLAELFGRYVSNATSSNESAAFQVAVWEIVHDGDLSLSQGSFRVQNNGAYHGIAQTWLDSLDGTGPRESLLVMSSPDAQDHVFVVPAPGAMACLSMLGMLGLRPRRRRTSL